MASSSQTGDLQNNLLKIQTELRHIKYPGTIEEYGSKKGHPSAFLPLLHYILLDYSQRLARRFASSGYELYAQKDARFVDSVYKLLRDQFGYRPALSKEQFLTTGFAERKLILIGDVIRLCRNLDVDLARGIVSDPVQPSHIIGSATTALGLVVAANMASATPPDSNGPLTSPLSRSRQLSGPLANKTVNAPPTASSSLKTTPSRLVQQQTTSTTTMPNGKRTGTSRSTSDSSHIPSAVKPPQPHRKLSPSRSAGVGNILVGNNVMLLPNKSPDEVSSWPRSHQDGNNAWSLLKQVGTSDVQQSHTHSRSQSHQNMNDSFPHSYLQSAEGGTLASLDSPSDQIASYNYNNNNNVPRPITSHPPINQREDIPPNHRLEETYIDAESIVNHPPSRFMATDAWSLHVAGKSSSPRKGFADGYDNAAAAPSPTNGILSYESPQRQILRPSMPSGTNYAYNTWQNPAPGEQDGRLLDGDLDGGNDASIAVEPSAPPLPHSDLLPRQPNQSSYKADGLDYPPLRRSILKTGDSPPRPMSTTIGDGSIGIRGVTYPQTSPKRFRIEEPNNIPQKDIPSLKWSTNVNNSQNTAAQSQQQYQQSIYSSQNNDYGYINLLPQRPSDETIASSKSNQVDADQPGLIRMLMSKVEDLTRANVQLRVEVVGMAKRIDSLENIIHSNDESIGLRLAKLERVYQQQQQPIPPPHPLPQLQQQHPSSEEKRTGTHLTNGNVAGVALKESHNGGMDGSNSGLSWVRNPTFVPSTLSSSLSRQDTVDSHEPCPASDIRPSESQPERRFAADPDESAVSHQRPLSEPGSSSATGTAQTIKRMEEKMRQLRERTKGYGSSRGPT
ncbi:hypothetical protein SmJEL517_g01337 [Synchytrium microbalum]|uniref:Centrosomal protein of 44 kDa n=1 Tax=Synchytrium microbalum TaxID=1806994 RepID=A0A507C641_9FUNG|nr:uncharacterized protein SmJEL517_g01337 [Synchytrium microbalum]TPX36497.1 hypothetical protein SmJEL517_g01337 [Synchytrium microbalum]